MANRLFQLFLCVMLLLQLGPVAPCLLDEALADSDSVPTAGENVSITSASATHGQICDDDDAGNPSLTQFRICVCQAGSNAASMNPYLFQCACLIVLPRLALSSSSSDDLVAMQQPDHGPPRDRVSGKILPLLI